MIKTFDLETMLDPIVFISVNFTAVGFLVAAVYVGNIN